MENFNNIEQNNPVNCVLNNKVDKDVQAMLLPFKLMQFMSFSPRYRIQNNCITPNGVILNLFSIIGTLIIISVYVIRTYMLFQYTDHLGFTKFMSVTVFVDCIFYSIGFATNFVIGIIQTENNIKFVLLFQRAHRLLNNSDTRFNHFVIWNWVVLILALGCYFIVFGYFNIKLALPWFYLFVDFLLVVFDLNVINAFRKIKSLEHKLVLWKTLVLNSIETEERRFQDFSKRMFQAYVDILECYDILKLCFQPLIMYYILEVFLHSLIYIEVIIETLKVGFRNNTVHTATLGLMSILFWLGKGLTWQTMFMQQCETFYIAIQSGQDSCALMLKSNCSDEERKLYKNVLRVHRASFSKMRVCGLFYADAALQQSLMSLLANYTIVLLQFAFL